MREVTLTWEEASLAKTDLVELTDVVDGLTFVANLHITPEGVRQVVLPSYKEGKTADDLDQIPYVEVEQHLMTVMARARGLEHSSLVCLAAKSTSIHVMSPTILENGKLYLTVRGCPTPSLRSSK